MSIIFILILISLTMAVGFLIAFLISVKGGQFSDTYTPSVRILFDDVKQKEEPKEEEDKNSGKSDKT